MIHVKEQIIADANDIEAILFECKCGAVQSAVPDAEIQPGRCHQCGTEWMTADILRQMINSFVNGLREVRMLKESGFTVQIALRKLKT